MIAASNSPAAKPSQCTPTTNDEDPLDSGLDTSGRGIPPRQYHFGPQQGPEAEAIRHPTLNSNASTSTGRERENRLPER